MLTLSNHVLGESNIVDWMPFAEEIRSTPPDWYFHLNSNKLVIAEDSSGFLIDCGSRRELDHLRNLKRTGRLKRLDGVFITHYHDDHTNLINEVVAEFGCPVYVTRELADILRQPGAFRMPCLTTNGIPNLTIMKEGEKMLWKEFTLTFLYFPGQTLYHDAVVFEKQGAETILFVGDSFTPAGIDDYCLQNRNILHEDKGYLYCLNVLKRYSNALLSNQHIRPLFAFSELQLDHMRNVLLDRNRILADLLPWDDINYGTDDQWIAVYPYSQKARRGQTIDYRVKVSNYSRSANVFTLTPKIPKGYRVEPKSVALVVDALKQGEYSFKVTVSEEAAAGVSLLLFDVKFDEWDLREWSEGMIEIEGQ